MSGQPPMLRRAMQEDEAITVDQWSEDGSSSIYGHVRDDIHNSGRYLRYAPSAESLLAVLENKRHRTPPNNLSNDTLVNNSNDRSCAWWPSWQQHKKGSLSAESIHEIFVQLTNAFGFQRDSMDNMYDHLMTMLDSRASRMASATQALRTLHADYIGGPNANYRQWCLALQDPEDKNKTEKEWQADMECMSDTDRVRQLALWLLIWGEASVLRFCPEALCFLFQCANDYDGEEILEEGQFLDTIITPLYNFLRDQSFRKSTRHGTYRRRDRDHAEIIGYDDVNQLFWSREGLGRLRLKKKDRKTRLMDIPASKRYGALKDVEWERAFQKTFKEKRSWMHLAVNFSRVWIIHIVSFWYFIAPNAGILYLHEPEKDDERPVQLSMAALGGGIATLLVILAHGVEYIYVPITWQRVGILARKLVILLLILFLNVGPSVYCFSFDRTSPVSMAVAVGQLLVSLVTSVFFAVKPQSRLFFCNNTGAAEQAFTANFYRLKRMDRLISIGIWACVFGCKWVESYYFVALSFKDPLKSVAQLRIQDDYCHGGDVGTSLCKYMPVVALALMFLMALVLFFLDTYLWYIIWNTVFSVARSFYLGVSIWTPWRNIFSRLPKRIYAKILAVSELETTKPKVLCSQIWNAFVIAMYREHLLSSDHVARLLYQQVPDGSSKQTLKTPNFFVSQEDVAFKTEYYPQQSEAERRMQFFAQSLTTPMPEPLPVPNMPTFTVLIPHYSEKILLSLREVIREEDDNARVTLLEYLKKLHPFEWDNFVKDTKVLAEELTTTGQEEEGAEETDSVASSKTRIAPKQKHADDLPFYCVGFKSSAPEYTLRTRIWASLRTQTLYRTVTGFMNYHQAIKLLYRVEQQEAVDPATEAWMANRKFRLLLAMQRYTSFNKEEKENAEFLLNAYPDLQIAYLEHDQDTDAFYSVLVDGHCPVQANGERAPKYRIRLPGNPILGDGKADNQNHALIFYRGEYLQLIDANQDNYLEECLKIRNVLGEFENYYMKPEEQEISPYAPRQTNPVAIVGAREYIFSENVGILGDIAAGKEQTFGTLSQRIMATIGGKLHYGHPDFLNAIFMTTRGGVSKAQKGLHLNEDIYAGMNAFQRGGRIKHVEYFQCGKGRDLGFGSILNFVTKIGTGMGEQMLSREYYYLGTQLPLDRFLTFYYAHPGFHINNIFIMLSVQLFMLVLLVVGAMALPLTSLCKENAPLAEDKAPEEGECHHLVPVFEWLKRVVVSIFIVFFISFCPLFLQELTERGFLRALTRLAKQMLSFSPFFEIFVTQTYAQAILDNLTFGGARYIATGRGFATSRVPFSVLYGRFAPTSMYFGARSLLVLLFASMVIWIPHLIYFWITVLALVLSPFLFNPHQFALTDFLMDYREFLRWMSRGNGGKSNSKKKKAAWIDYCRLTRARITGVKRKNNNHGQGHQPRARFFVVFFSEIGVPLVFALLCLTCYVFVKSIVVDAGESSKPNGLLRIGIVALGPVALNAAVVAGLFPISLLFGSLCCCCSSRGAKYAGASIAFIAHAWAVINQVVFFELLYFMEDWKLSQAILGMVTAKAVERFVFKVMTVLLLSREFQQGESNQAWWTGRWHGRGLGWHALSQPLREYVCKIIEMSMFATDIVMGHCILFVLFLVCLVPGIDNWHSLMLFWLRPGQQIREPIYTISQKRRRRRIAIMYGLFIVALFVLFLALLIAPALVGSHLSSLHHLFSSLLPPILQ